MVFYCIVNYFCVANLPFQELIGLIKNTKIPIICMCNDRNHPKIRSLVHYCFDLRFQRPRVEQIKVWWLELFFHLFWDPFLNVPDKYFLNIWVKKKSLELWLCQFQGAMMSIAFKEGLKIPPPALNEIILGANQDIRQVNKNIKQLMVLLN